VNANPAPTDIEFINTEAHLNYDGFRFDGSLSSAMLVNCKAYANRNSGITDNTGGHASYSYSHFYANDIAIFNSQDVYGAIDGGNNIASDTAPEVFSFARYPARITLTVDDEGKAPGGADFIDSILPEFTNRGVRLSIAVVAGEQYAAPDSSRIQAWLDAGHDINSHSWSHNYYTTPNMFSVGYTGTGTAAILTISGNRLTTSVTGGPGGENLDLDLSNSSYDEYTKLVGVINGRSGYSAGLIGLPHGHSITLADVTAQDIKNAAYTVQLQKDRFIPDEMSTSKAWLQSNISGLSNVKVYVYPSGYEDAQTQGWAVAAGYEGGRGGLSMGLGNKELYQSGANLQDITSLAVSSVHGMSEEQIRAKMKALTFKSSAWGAPYGLFCHPGELSAAEVGYILDGLLAGGATIMTNTGLVEWLAATSNISGTTYYTSAAIGPILNLSPTSRSPIHHAGNNQGTPYNIDIAGVLRPSAGWDIGAYQTYFQKHGRGAGSNGWTKYGVVAVP
jgi:peptidoglycan/xylan/chitin deacetylase (PgdA/CDA1 family)